jgi:hypothetical protein
MDDRLLEDAVRGELAEWGVVRPPYLAFPGIDPYDIGWRMGAGEWHIMVWSRWWGASHPDEESRLAYFRHHPPPPPWLAWTASAIWADENSEDADEGSEDEDDTAVRRLEAHGIATYADWRAWLNEAEE